MKVIRAKDYDEMSRKAASIIAAQVILKPDSVLGLATGSTPLGIYKCLIEDYQAGDLDFSRVCSVNLDEYKGISRSNSQSYYYFMQENLFQHINIEPGNTHIPDGINTEALFECARYSRIIKRMGGIDLQLLGLGLNGHIGFNEPNEVFTKQTHLVRLAQSTIEANARFFNHINEVPNSAYTMGIGQIISAKKILLAVNGAAKAEILMKVLEGGVTPRIPASILQFHEDVTVVADYDAAALLKEY